MTLEQKNFILGFLEISRINKNLEDLEEEIKDRISVIVDILPNKEKVQGIELENKIYNFIDLTKSKYFDFGVSAEKTLENINLKWTPKGYKKEVRQNDIK